jgi:hypothetical protein
MVRTVRDNALAASVAVSLVGLAPAPAFAQGRSSDSLADSEDNFTWYEPGAADGMLPLPPPRQPEERYEPIPPSEQTPPNFLLSAGAIGRTYFLGTPSGTSTEIVGRLSWGAVQWFGAEVGLLAPDNMIKFGLTVGFPFALTIARPAPHWQVDLLLPMLRLDFGFYPIKVTRSVRNSSVPLIDRTNMLLFAPELVPVGLRISSCLRFFVEARLDGPGAWFTFGNAFDTFAMSLGASVHLGVGLGGGGPITTTRVATTRDRRTHRPCDNTISL